MDKAEPRTQQERVYKQLREAIMSGQFVPGRAVTLRGVAQMLDVSPMPVREALRRLTSERALELLENRRIAVPQMTYDKLQEICDARVALESAAAQRALPGIDREAISRLRALDGKVNEAIDSRDVPTYITSNYRFHAILYSYGNSEVTLPLIESLWLQTAPFMRLVLEHRGMGDQPDRHRDALLALEAADGVALTKAIALDIQEGPGAIGQEELDRVYNEAIGLD
jgi:DNA-binding GntR family transcriptional regulator